MGRYREKRSGCGREERREGKEGEEKRVRGEGREGHERWGRSGGGVKRLPTSSSV